jgi:hypothetical protein
MGSSRLERDDKQISMRVMIADMRSTARDCRWIIEQTRATIDATLIAIRDADTLLLDAALTRPLFAIA